MDRHKVESSNIAAIGYDEETQTLEVEFKPNRRLIAVVWQYAPVALSAYECMIDPSQSVGKVLFGIKNDPSVSQVRLADLVACPDCERASEEFTLQGVCPTCEAALTEAI